MGLTFAMVEDHPVFADGLRRAIEVALPWRCIWHARGEAEAMRMLGERRPDLLMVDLTLREGSGLSLVQRVTRTWDELRCVVVTMSPMGPEADAARRAGAVRVLGKGEEPSAMIAALRTLVDRMGGPARATEDPLEVLSDREREVLTWMGAGLDTRQIAQRLFISPKTVETHRMRIKQKLQVDNLYELVRIAVRHLA